MNAILVLATNGSGDRLTRDSWIFDTGALFHICNDWSLMEDVVEVETRAMTASTVRGISLLPDVA